MSQVTDIRKAIASSVMDLPVNFNPHVTTGRTEYEDGAVDSQVFTLLCIATGDDQDDDPEDRLDALLERSGPTSVKEAVEADRNLGGLVLDLRVAATSGMRMYPNVLGQNKPPELGAEWTINVLLEGD